MTSTTWATTPGSSGPLGRKLIVPAIAAVFLTVVYLVVQQSLIGLEQEYVHKELTTIRDVEISSVRSWLDHQVISSRMAASNQDVVALVVELNQLTAEPGWKPEQIRVSEPLKRLRAILGPICEAHGSNDFLVINHDGVNIASSYDDAIGLSCPDDRSPAVRQALGGKPTVSHPVKSEVYLEDLTGAWSPGVPTMFALTPILTPSDSRPLAAFAMRLRPRLGFGEILAKGRIGDTGETYAFDRRGMMLSPSRFEDELRKLRLIPEDPAQGSPLNVRLSHVNDQLTTGVARAIQQTDGVDVEGYADYRGKQVVGAWSWIPEYDLGIITEVDRDEAFRGLYRLQRLFLLLFGVLILFAGWSIAGSFVAGKLRADVARARKLGQYTLERKIGEGGMGEVYLARHALLRRPTAIKMLKARDLDEADLHRFEREVQLTSSLSHPNTIAIYDYGQTPEGVFYYAMEYLRGINLEQLLAKEGPIPAPRVLHFLGQICGSLREAHGAGLIHRDIKPANILICERGGACDVVKVLDFGLVKELDTVGEPTVTSANVLTGTPAYMAPEVVRTGGAADQRSDIYALGCLAWRILTDKMPFVGESALDVLDQQLRHTPPSPATLVGTPEDVSAIVMKCMEKDPTKRPQSMQEIIDAARKCADWRAWTTEDAREWWALHRDDIVEEIENSAETPTAHGPGGGGSIAIDMRRRRGSRT